MGEINNSSRGLKEKTLRVMLEAQSCSNGGVDCLFESDTKPERVFRSS
ncbi:hypothetical protein C344_00135 [Cryptococcus neoformans AD1-7a]|nr:hypothetical protein C344_00135 [Cryptococcus neoformans var. grubii AD1-7a]